MSHLMWGGADCLELAERFGTPLYVFDEGIIRARCAEIKRDFLSKWPRTSACYSGKAFLTTAMARIADSEGLGLDVTSMGELRAALAAGFPPERIELHGNAKSDAELKTAAEIGVGRIIVDNMTEAEILSGIASRAGRTARILLRAAPGIEPHTHAFISTGQTGSKFGFPLDALPDAVRAVSSMSGLELMGVHLHVGSQIFEPDAHVKSVGRVAEAVCRLKAESGFEAREINFGGGYGAVGNPAVKSVRLADFTDAMMGELERIYSSFGLERPDVTIETGRWVVSEACVTLYRVEVVKELDGITYVAVDGGMADNPRFPLYGAVYDAAYVNDCGAPCSDWGGNKLSIVGRCCESGDILIDDARLPRVKRGDVIALYSSGAYTYSMASNYNMLCRPAVVLVKDGRADIIVRRQTPDDLLQWDVIPDRLN